MVRLFLSAMAAHVHYPHGGNLAVQARKEQGYSKVSPCSGQFSCAVCSVVLERACKVVLFPKSGRGMCPFFLPGMPLPGMSDLAPVPAPVRRS